MLKRSHALIGAAAGVTVAHLAGELMTPASPPTIPPNKHGPLSRRRMALPRLLAIKTGGVMEVVVVVGVLALTAWSLLGDRMPG